MVIKYLGYCRKCEVALYSFNGIMRGDGAAADKACDHVLATSRAYRMNKVNLTPEQDAYITMKAKQKRCYRSDYIRALINADMEKERKKS